MGRNFVREAVQGSLERKLDVPKIFYGWLGNADDVVEVPNRINYVYVTMNDGMVTQAYNVVVPNILNLPVICGYDQNQLSSGLLKVISVRNIPRQTASTVATPNTLVAHHKSHEWNNANGGNDIVYTELRQFMPLRPSIVSPFSVYINRGVLNLGGAWRYIQAQELNLQDYIPTTLEYGLSGSAVQGRFALISLSASSGSAVVTSGSLKPITSIALTDIPATPAGHYPLCAVYLYYYQEEIVESRTKTDLIDLRYGMFDNTNEVGDIVVPTGKTPTAGYYLTGYDAVSGSFASGSSVLPKTTAPVADYYFTGYDASSGSFSSGSVAPSGGASGSHNSLPGLQGGASGSPGEYYHLTNAQHTIAITASGSGADGYLASSDWQKFNAASGSGVQNLSELLDVDIGSQTDGQALVWDDGSSTWIPGTVSGGSGTSGSQVVPLDHPPVENFYLTGYSAASGSFASGSVIAGAGGSQVVPINTAPVEDFYLTGYDAVSGSFSSGSVVGGTSGSRGTTGVTDVLMVQVFS